MANNFGTQYILAAGSGTSYEPIRKSSWSVTVGGIDVSLIAKSVNIPETEVDPIVIHHFNEQVQGAGRPKPSDITLEIVDYIAPDGFSQLNAWFTQVYDSTTGIMGYAGDYKRTVKIKQMDQKGNVVRTWTASGCWPKNMPVPEGLDYSSSEALSIKLTLACDRVTANPSSGTGGQSTTF